MNKQDVLDYLNSNGIKYEIYEHKAVFTCVEADVHCKGIPGITSKSLLVKAIAKTKSNSDASSFLLDSKTRDVTRKTFASCYKDQFYLCLVPSTKKLDNKGLELIIGIKKIRFANPEELMQLLGLTPGSVSPFGLINDKEHRVKLLIDDSVSRSEYVQFHPNVNTATLVLKQEEFQKFLELTKVEKKVEKLTT